jgi:hypothetical protein
MKRIFATALLVAGLVAAPVAALAWESRPAPHVPIPNNVYSRQWNPRVAPGFHPGHRPHHLVVGPRFVGPSVVVVSPPVVVAQPAWVEPGWQWNGWQWVWVPGYWAQ